MAHINVLWICFGWDFLEKVLSDNILKYSQMFYIMQPTQVIVYYVMKTSRFICEAESTCKVNGVW